MNNQYQGNNQPYIQGQPMVDQWGRPIPQPGYAPAPAPGYGQQPGAMMVAQQQPMGGHVDPYAQQQAMAYYQQPQMYPQQNMGMTQHQGNGFISQPMQPGQRQTIEQGPKRGTGLLIADEQTKEGEVFGAVPEHANQGWKSWNQQVEVTPTTTPVYHIEDEEEQLEEDELLSCEGGIVFNNLSHEIVETDTKRELKGQDMDYQRHSGTSDFEESDVVWAEEPEDIRDKLSSSNVSTLSTIPVSGTIAASSIEDGEFVVALSLGSSEPFDGSKSYSYVISEDSPYAYDSEGTHTATPDEFVEPGAFSSFTALHSRLTLARLPLNVGGAFQTKVLQAINIYISQLGWSVDNIADFPELLNAVAENFDESGLEKFITTLNSITMKILHLTDDAIVHETINTLATIDEIDEAVEQDLDAGDEESVGLTACILQDPIFIVNVPRTLDETQLEFTGEYGGSVQKSITPALYDFLEDVLEKARGIGFVGYKIIIRTLDDKRFYLTKRWLGDGFYLTKYDKV